MNRRIKFLVCIAGVTLLPLAPAHAAPQAAPPQPAIVVAPRVVHIAPNQHYRPRPYVIHRPGQPMRIVVPMPVYAKRARIAPHRGPTMRPIDRVGQLPQIRTREVTEVLEGLTNH